MPFVCDNTLAHAELNALLALKADRQTRHAASLYTTTEPCPLCLGAFYMSGVRTLHYAAREPFAGSTNLLGTTPYLSRKPIKVYGPADPDLEALVTALAVEARAGLRAFPQFSSAAKLEAKPSQQAWRWASGCTRTASCAVCERRAGQQRKWWPRSARC